MKILSKKKNFSLSFIAFWQALGVIVYCSLVALLFWRGERWFGKMNHYFGPVFLLVLFSTSVLVCALLTFGYPFVLFWEKKETKKALKMVIYTAAWLTFFTAIFVVGLLTYHYSLNP